MESKQTYITTIEELIDISQKHQLSKELTDSMLITKEKMKQFVVKMPIIGGFNAGKSSLLNSYFGEDVLPVEVTPETAIAAEISYGENAIIAHGHEGNHDSYSLKDFHSIDADQYKYIEVRLENEKLKGLEDVVIVDMPGFDSGIAEHNKAIFQYLQEGVAFMIVIDCEDGSIKSSVLQFIYELDLYDLNYGVLINKIDKKPKSEVDEIVENIRKTIHDISPGVPVDVASDRLEYGNDGFQKIIDGLQKENLFIHQFNTEVQQYCSRVKMNLEVILRNADADVSSINQRIKEIEKKMKKLNEKLQQEEKLMTHKLHNEVKENILTDVQNVLMNESHNLALSAKAGQSSFNQKINDLIRPVLISSTNQHLELTFSDVIKNISEELTDMSNIAQGNDARQKFSGAISVAEVGLDKLQNKEFLQRFEKLYKVSFGGLAIITAVIAPWIEIVLFFLPEILKLFGFGNEKDQMEKIQSQIESEAIPKITMKIRENIDGNLEEVKEEFMQNLSQEIQKENEELQQSLEQAIAQKEQKEFDSEKYESELKKDIEQVKQLQTSVSLGV